MKSCILTTFYNPTKSKNKIKNFFSFYDSLKKQKLNDLLYVCEISHDGQFEIKGIDNYYQITNSDFLWHKESAINYLLTKIKNDFDGVILADCDIKIDNNNWYDKTNFFLNDYVCLQPFEKINYLNWDNSFVEYTDNSIFNFLSSSYFVDRGNPGALIAYRRDYLDSVGGLFSKCLIGGGDTINIIPFCYDKFFQLKFLDRVCKDIRYEIFDYFDKCLLAIKKLNKKNYTFLENINIFHMFHGLIKQRSYEDRYKIINDLNFNDYFLTNFEGFFNIIKNSKNLNNQILNFYKSRDDDFFIENNTPIIVSTLNKLKKEQEGSWLCGFDNFYLSNIKKIKINLNKCHLNLNYFEVYLNNQKFLFDFKNQKEIELEFEDPKTISIKSDSYVPFSIKESEDIRNLSFLIKDIKIQTKNDNGYIDYPLEEIF